MLYRMVCTLFTLLFWHHEWHTKYGDGNCFYAVLDESTSALDVDSEAHVYAPMLR